MGVTKRRIEKKIKEHKKDIKKGRMTTALARLNAEEKIEIDFQSTKMLAEYENFNHALKREAMEIVSEHKAINCMEPAVVEQGWCKMIKKRQKMIRSEAQWRTNLAQCRIENGPGRTEI